MSAAVAPRPLTQWPAYPVLVCSGFVLSWHREAALPAEALFTPLLALVAAAVATQLVITLVARNWDVGAYVTLSLMGGLVDARVGGAMIGAAGVLVFVSLLDIRARLWWHLATRGFNAYAVLFAGMAVLLSIPTGSFVATPPQTSALAPARPDAPNIVILLLDGYPRSDSLDEDLSIDNDDFLRQLEETGFEVAGNSRSNYNMTQLTLASMLNMQHVGALEEVQAESEPLDQYRAFSRSIASPLILPTLRRYGYEVSTVASPFSAATMYQSDSVVQNHVLTDFEIGLITRSSLSELAPKFVRQWVTGWYRDALQADLESINSALAEPRDRPMFLLAHLLVPHPPLVFGPSDAGQPVFECFPATCEFWDSGWRLGADGLRPLLQDQLQFVNEEVLRFVRMPPVDDRPTVMIVMSDHGYRFGPNDPNESVRNLFAARTPGHRGLFPNDVTPVNLFPRLLGAYLNADLPFTTEESYWIDLSAVRTTGISGLERVAQ